MEISDRLLYEYNTSHAGFATWRASILYVNVL